MIRFDPYLGWPATIAALLAYVVLWLVFYRKFRGVLPALDRAISEGADAALPKPFGNKELVSKVKELMQPLVQSAGGVPG